MDLLKSHCRQLSLDAPPQMKLVARSLEVLDHEKISDLYSLTTSQAESVLVLLSAPTAARALQSELLDIENKKLKLQEEKQKADFEERKRKIQMEKEEAERIRRAQGPPDSLVVSAVNKEIDNIVKEMKWNRDDAGQREKLRKDIQSTGFHPSRFLPHFPLLDQDLFKLITQVVLVSSSVNISDNYIIAVHQEPDGRVKARRVPFGKIQMPYIWRKTSMNTTDIEYEELFPPCNQFVGKFVPKSE